MAKVKGKVATKAKPSAPTSLTMNLFAPGMTPLHRAGLGGLACTLDQMEKTVSKKQPKFWEQDEQSITLHFDPPELAGALLERLFKFAFRTTSDGLIYLPGQFNSPPQPPVLADLLLGLTLTFLQHGKTRTLAKTQTPTSYPRDGSGIPGVQLEYRPCSWFKHQDGWQSLIDNKGQLTTKPINIEGPISPGSVVRHVAFTSDTTASDLPERMLPLYFALVGCLAIPLNRGVAVLLIPELDDLDDFVAVRPGMTPQAVTEWQVSGAVDAALQMQVRVLSSQASTHLTAPGCYAVTLRPTPWASQQKSRVATQHVEAMDDETRQKFELAMKHLKPRVVIITRKETTGKGKSKQIIEHQEAIRIDSVVRPLIAENLAQGKRWYAGFRDLMTKMNPASCKPYYKKIFYERQGLHAMTKESKMWTTEQEQGERLFVEAVHEAISRRYGRIASENQTNKSARESRWNRFNVRLRIGLSSAKTESETRFVLTDLFSRGGNNSILKAGWQAVLPVLRKEWQLARDLGLLALASYSGKGVTEDDSETKPE